MVKSVVLYVVVFLITVSEQNVCLLFIHNSKCSVLQIIEF